MTVWITDWTHWQGRPLNARAVADEGFGMVKLKVGGSANSWSFEDPTFSASAASLLNEPRMIPSAYWYLYPDRPYAQAAMFYERLRSAGSIGLWATFLDVEQPGVNASHVRNFCDGWSRLTGGKRLSLYTSRYFYENNIGPDRMAPLMPVLEDARWVSSTIREDPGRPYASQHARAIEPIWWTLGYGGWSGPDIIQFTDRALIDGKRNVASIYRGSRSELRNLLGVTQ